MTSNRFAPLLAAAVLASTPAAFATTVIAPDESLMTSSFFQGTDRVRGYDVDNRPVLRVSTDAPFGNNGPETIYLSFDFDFSTFAQPVAATLTLQSVAGGFNADASAANPFTVSAHAVNADPISSITDNTNLSGPINWLAFYNNNVLPSTPAASTVINGFGSFSFDVSSIVNDWRTGSNTVFTIALTGANDTSSTDFLHGFRNNTETPGSTFLSVSAVPEPSAYALMLAGLVGVAFVASRRQAQRKDQGPSA